MNTILGQKLEQTQKFLENGHRVPVTRVKVSGNVVLAVKTAEKHGYMAVQLGFGSKKKANKALLGHIKGANLTVAPKFLKEVRLKNAATLSIGDVLKATELFANGDIVDVKGVSKGKGYAGVVKRHHFKGGPRTHGQSDRERAPGSIGQTTTPGRVYKGKRMAGRMGVDNVTMRNLQVVGVTDNEIWIKGLVPGYVSNFLIIEKKGEGKKFVPMHHAFSLEKPTETTKVDDVEKVEAVKVEEPAAEVVAAEVASEEVKEAVADKEEAHAS